MTSEGFQERCRPWAVDQQLPSSAHLLVPQAKATRNFQDLGAALTRDPASPRAPGLASSQWPAALVSPPPSTPASSRHLRSEPRLFSRVAKGGLAGKRWRAAGHRGRRSEELGRDSTAIVAENSCWGWWPRKRATPQGNGLRCFHDLRDN